MPAAPALPTTTLDILGIALSLRPPLLDGLAKWRFSA